ncbi:3-dehydroquinate synthase [Peribacillus loiseleuriae]|uniref:3-dehydroquinate synthase n=1 Tax=Peribacillus loiseleuriae TaxID=1679170 RepID=UPI0037F3B028
MESIDIKTPSKEYPVFLGKHVIEQLPLFLEKNYSDITKLLIISDEKVASIHLHKVKELAVKSGKQVLEYIVPEGEHAKTFDVFYQCQSFALANGLNRKSMILALGGGAVGDVAGFVAATFMRGIPFIQLPTTLLAHDSAVGGKVAINHPEGKNMIGAFYQPEAVFYELSFLHTLPIKELRSGFAEVIKHALIQDPEFYKWLLTEIQDLAAITDEQYLYMIKRGIAIKASIVNEDEKENGVRAYLNFGHTLGHAVEGLMGYGNFTHGEAVLIGCVYALKLSQHNEGLNFDLVEFMEWVQSLGYSTNIPKQLDHTSLIKKMKKDKKTISDTITFVLLNEVGFPVLAEINDEIILKQLEEIL